MKELRNCPFCNSNFVRIKNDELTSFVHCEYCGAKGPIVYFEDKTKTSTKEWNKRALVKKL